MKTNLRNRSIIISTFFLFAFAQQDIKISAWEKVKVKNGISVFTRENSLSEIKEVRAEVKIKASLSAVVYLIKRAEKQTEWAYATADAKVLKHYNNFHWVAYTRTDAPWPVDDRDCVTDVTMHQLSDSTIVIKSYNLDSMVKEVEGVIRMPMIKGSWVLTPIDAHTTKARFQILLDLGGSVPSWVVNLFIENGPYNTLMDFHEEIKKEKYQKIHLSYIKQP